MDSREFEVLVDVIGWAQGPGPSIETVGAEGELLAGGVMAAVPTAAALLLPLGCCEWC